jgi:hypothetical protein
MVGACSADGEEERRVRVLVEKPEGKGPLGRPRRRWEDNIRMDVQKGGCAGWNRFGWLRIETGGERCECGNELSGLIKRGNFLTSYKPVSFSRRTLLHRVSK